MERDFKLDRNLYRETMWFIRRYPALKRESESFLGVSGVAYDGQPHGTGTSDATVQAVIKRERVVNQISIIDTALNIIPQEYRKGVFKNCVYGDMFPQYADTSTWKRWKRRFVFYVAKGRGDV